MSNTQHTQGENYRALKTPALLALRASMVAKDTDAAWSMVDKIDDELSTRRSEEYTQ